MTDSKLLDGPWDLTIDDDGTHAQVFVSNVLSGTVTRIDLVIPKHGIPQVISETQIASGYEHNLDPTALVIGPTGLAFDEHTNTLYVASTGDNEIFAVHNAATTNRDQGKGTLFVKDTVHLHGPLGLVLAPNGDLIAANGDAPSVNPGGTPNELVEFNSKGPFRRQFPGRFRGGWSGVWHRASDARWQALFRRRQRQRQHRRSLHPHIRGASSQAPSRVGKRRRL